jgi:hypothetical protein
VNWHAQGPGLYYLKVAQLPIARVYARVGVLSEDPMRWHWGLTPRHENWPVSNEWVMNKHEAMDRAVALVVAQKLEEP